MFKHTKTFFLLGSILSLSLLAACGSSSTTPTPEPTPEPTPVGGVSTTSGGLATINTGSSVIGFIPVGLTVLAVPLDTGSASDSVSGLSKATLRSANLSIDVSFTINSCGADATDLKVVCVGYTSSMVAILDVADYVATLQDGGTPTADEITVSEVDLGNTDSASFSGGSCTNCGVLCDAGESRFIVSSGDGYRVLDYSGTVLTSYLTDLTSDPVRDLGTENFSFDSENKWIISPEYETSNNYLWIVDLTNDAVYRWTNRMVPTSTDATNGLEELSSDMVADAASVDPTTGALLIGDEYADSFLTVNLNAATFDDAAGTFTAPHDYVTMTNIVAPGLMSTGMAIESSSHLLFLEDEFGSSMGLVSLPTAAAAGSISLSDYTTAAIPSPTATCASVFSWSNVGDPHGLALFTGVIDDAPKGLLINSDKTCAAIVDLDSFLAADDATTPHSVDPTIDLEATGVITFISLE